MEGMIHSVVTFGTVDGPGIRYVLFLKGCPMRCLYCHNPDTWSVAGAKKMTVDEIMHDYERYRPFLKNGGLTVSGGEPLVQIDFVTELFEEAKRRGIHTCLDTSGIMFRRNNPINLKKHERLIEVTDVTMLDIKHIDLQMHMKLTSQPADNIFDFLRFLDENNKEIWLRHVLVPGYTLVPEYLERLGRFLAEFKNIKALDVLPYHDMGKTKYKEMGIPYALEDVKPVEKEAAVEAREEILSAMKIRRSEMNEEDELRAAGKAEEAEKLRLSRVEDSLKKYSDKELADSDSLVEEVLKERDEVRKKYKTEKYI